MALSWGGRGVLGEAQVAGAERPEVAVGPGLPGDPVGGGPPVTGFAVEADLAAGAERAPGALHHRVIAALGEEPGGQTRAAPDPAAAVRGPDQDRGPWPGRA